jgi:PAS domain S-box-containing protein
MNFGPKLGRERMTVSWQAIVEALPIAVVVLTPEGYVRSVNARAATLTGYTREQLVGQDLGLLLPDPGRRELMQRVQSLFDDASGVSPPLELEVRGRRQDGTSTPWLISVDVLRENDPVALLTIANVERQARTDTAVRAEELFLHSPEVVFEMRVTDDGRFVQEALNPSALRVTKTTLDQVTGHEVSQFFPAGAAEIVTAKYRECAELGRPIDYETELDFGEGPRAYHTFLVPIFASNGRLERIAGFARDVTYRRNVELALRESEAIFATAFRASPYSITISELSTGRYLDVNEGFLAISGYTRDEVVGP